MRLILLLLCVGVAAFPQGLSFGVKGGVPLTDAFQTSANPLTAFASDTRRYTVGPTVEVRLPLGLGIELDALYKRLNYRSTASGVELQRTTANSWEFPLLLKSRLGVWPARPYVAVGASFNHLSGITHISSFLRGSERPAELQNRFRSGFVIGAGLEVSAPVVRIAPEIRFTRWGWENFRDVGGLLRSNENQAEFLIGITF